MCLPGHPLSSLETQRLPDPSTGLSHEGVFALSTHVQYGNVVQMHINLLFFCCNKCAVFYPSGHPLSSLETQRLSDPSTGLSHEGVFALSTHVQYGNVVQMHINLLFFLL